MSFPHQKISAISGRFPVLRRPVIAATSVGSACWIFAGGLFAFFVIGGGGSIGVLAIGDDE
jgi:hypothetical protein